MNRYPANPNLGTRKVKTHGKGLAVIGNIVRMTIAAAKATVASTTGILAAFATSTSATVKTSGFTQPSVPRNITATAGGTAGDIKAVQVSLEGTDFADVPITETLPAFTVDTAGTVVGSKAFKTITKATVPAMDGTGATVSLGFGEKLGLPFRLAHNTVLAAYLDNTKEGTAPTVTTSTSELASNTVDLNSALNSKVVDVYLMVS